MKLFDRLAYLNTNHLGFCLCGGKELLLVSLTTWLRLGWVFYRLWQIGHVASLSTQPPSLPCLPLL